MKTIRHPLAGVYVAALTPLKPDFSLDPDSIPRLLDFYAQRGCHGALLLGTTGEGPSFAPAERIEIFRAALAIHRSHPDFRLLVGTGTPSLQETTDLTRAAFDLSLEGVVVLPPYYFRKVGDDGLFAWFDQVLRKAVPSGGALLAYHIPGVSGVPVSLDLLARLKDAHPNRFVGVKDSSGDPDYARQLGAHFGTDLLVLNGNDKLFQLALESHAGGCITAMANLFSPDLRQAWEVFQQGGDISPIQARLSALRLILDRYAPFPPILKALIARMHGFPRWAVRPPLLNVTQAMEEAALQEFTKVASNEYRETRNT